MFQCFLYLMTRSTGVYVITKSHLHLLELYKYNLLSAFLSPHRVYIIIGGSITLGFPPRRPISTIVGSLTIRMHKPDLFAWSLYSLIFVRIFLDETVLNHHITVLSRSASNCLPSRKLSSVYYVPAPRDRLASPGFCIAVQHIRWLSRSHQKKLLK